MKSNNVGLIQYDSVIQGDINIVESGFKTLIIGNSAKCFLDPLICVDGLRNHSAYKEGVRRLHKKRSKNSLLLLLLPGRPSPTYLHCLMCYLLFCYHHMFKTTTTTSNPTSTAATTSPTFATKLSAYYSFTSGKTRVSRPMDFLFCLKVMYVKSLSNPCLSFSP